MFGLECLIDLVVDADLVAVENMIRAGKEFLYFLKVRSYACVCGVLLSVDRTALKREVKLAPRKRCGLCSDCRPEVHVILVLHRTNLKFCEIRQCLQIFIGRRKSVCRVLHEAEKVKPGFFVSG